MPYSIQIIRESKHKTNIWSGGTTTQLVIDPKDAVYGQDPFNWRLSTAKVNLPESSFTPLPGIQRLLMVLEGTVKLSHEGHYAIQLEQFEQDCFRGDWTTTCIGTATDFNLMLSQGYEGQLTAISLPGKTKQIIRSRPAKINTSATFAFYCLDGTVSLTINQTSPHELHKGDVLLIHTGHRSDECLLSLTNGENSTNHIIAATVQRA